MGLAQELQELQRLKKETEAAGRDKTERSAAFQRQQQRCLNLMEAEGCESYRTGGVLFTANRERMKGQIEDRRLYVRWALEQDEGVQEFLERWGSVLLHAKAPASMVDELEEDLFEVLSNLSMLKLKEDGHVINQQARAHVDDERPLPPGLTFRPDPYVQQRSS